MHDEVAALIADGHEIMKWRDVGYHRWQQGGAGPIGYNIL
jgi:hypothetical protein